MSFILSLLIACSSESSIRSADASFNSSASEQKILSNADVKVQNPDDIEAVITTKANLNMAIVEADGKYHTWMEGRSGVLRTEPKTSFWFEQGGLSTTSGKGQLHMEIDGHSFYTAGPISKISITSKLEKPPKNTSTLAISLEMTSKGKYITSLTQKDARNIRVASSIQKPTRSAILQVQNPEKSMGEPTPALSKTVIDQIKTTGKIPETATKMKATPPSASNLAKWNGELKGIFGNIANIGWSTMINLDGDKYVEAIVCTPTPKSKTCFVYDEIGPTGRYYDSGFKWDGKSAPTIFTVNDKSYIHHMYPLKKGAVHKLMQFDGSGYNSIQF
jgi:hypothetical protein